jgi:dTDP-glucose 4,6-dehydratase
MRVLLTGAGGFIGAHCLKYFLENTDWHIVCIDSFCHKGIPLRITDLIPDINWHRVDIIKHDLTTPILYPIINKIGKIDIIVNMASDSAVERSGDDPRSCLVNNYNLMINMLEYARQCQPKIFFHVSTDEVYGEAAPGYAHVEWSSIVPSNPYAASKAAQEAVAISYWRCFNIPLVITNTVNNFGEAQDTEKFLPKIIKHVLTGKEMPIYGDTKNKQGTRFYLHASNHADVFVFLSEFEPTRYESGKNQLPDRYNVSGGPELTNFDLAMQVASMLNKPLDYKLVPFETARSGYDKRYCLDDRQLCQMGWSLPTDFLTGLEHTVKWSLKHKHWIM